MVEHPDLAVFRQLHASFSAGDMNALAELFAEDVVWHTSGRNTLSGTYEGRQPALASFAREAELCGNTYRVEVHDVLANDQHTVALLRATAQREGRELDQDYVIVFHIRDTRVIEAWEIWADQAAVDQFWS